MKKTKANTTYFDKITENTELGVPMTPGRWASKPIYKDVTILYMKGPIGYTGLRDKEVLEKIDFAEISQKMQTNTPLIAKTFDGRTIVLNLRYMTKCEDFTMVSRDYNSENWNFQTGIYTCRWLLPLGNKVTFSDKLTHSSY